MNLGFKTGPRNWDEARTLVAEGAQLCEVWFDVTKADSYDEVLAWLRSQGVRVGLHHWGLAPGSIKTNLMTNDTGVRTETMAQVKQTIDIGTRLECAYINIHPGARALERLDFITERQSIVAETEVTPLDEASRFLLEAAMELHVYAEARGVVLTVETLPGRENEKWGGREERIYDPGNTTLKQMQTLVDASVWLGNDLTHTAAQVAAGTPEPDDMWRQVYAFSQKNAARTRLVHVNTMREPFNGTDSHDGLLPEDFAAGVWPTRERVLDFLRLFAGRDDVCVIPEPRSNMTGNYHELVQLVSEVKSSS